ncbi:hypothetical protein EYF80_038020 [Liparis tanakae]|uniref:Uncharacterized protein n=1 Tax=Liparis tanakae TaxID=230148 RepID=A0A4Z2GGJ7_9TELE|nr:hypothetical protein EYF80_038020 [Liparis tanakae]
MQDTLLPLSRALWRTQDAAVPPKKPSLRGSSVSALTTVARRRRAPPFGARSYADSHLLPDATEVSCLHSICRAGPTGGREQPRRGVRPLDKHLQRKDGGWRRGRVSQNACEAVRVVRMLVRRVDADP